MFTSDEGQALQEHALAVFRGKIIYEAQPGITPEQEREIAKRLAGPIPEQLLALWRQCFGGTLDYNLTAAFGTHRYTASLRELFYPGSDGYHDLYGWMGHELELARDAAEERGEPLPDRLDVLPIGGFEYLERIYVEVSGEHAGRVLLWAQGLPPAWTMHLTQDSICVLAPSVNALLDMLCLDEDPRSADPDSYPRGLEALEAIDALRGPHPDLAANVERILLASVFDWRAVVETQANEGTAEHERAGRRAAKVIASQDDVALLESLLNRGYPVDGIVSGNATLLALTIAQGSFAAARRLLTSGRALGDVTIVRAEGTDESLTQSLLGHDVAWDAEAPLSMAESGEVAAALLVIERGRRAQDWGDLRQAILDRAESNVESAKRVEAGQLHSSRSPADYRERYANLKRLAHEL